MRKIPIAFLMLAVVVSVAFGLPPPGYEWKFWYQTATAGDPYGQLPSWKTTQNIVAECSDDGTGDAWWNGYAVKLWPDYTRPCSNWIDIETLVTYICPPVVMDAPNEFVFELYENKKGQNIPDLTQPLVFVDVNEVPLPHGSIPVMSFVATPAWVWYKAHVPHWYWQVGDDPALQKYDGIPLFYKDEKDNPGFWVVVRSKTAPQSNIFMIRDGAYGGTPAGHGARFIKTADYPAGAVRPEPNPDPAPGSVLPMLDGDVIIAALVSKHHWELSSILVPGTTHPGGSTIVPKVRVVNKKPFKQVPENPPFTDKADIRFWIKKGATTYYDQTISVILPDGPLPANQTADFIFPSFPIPTGNPGTWTAKCTLIHWNDWSRNNKVKSKNFNVTFLDVGFAGGQILEPVGSYPENSPVTPAVEIENCGNMTATFQARLWIEGTGYSEVVTVADLEPGATRVVSFPEWSAGPAGPHAVRCEVIYGGDANPLNNSVGGTVEVTPAAPPRADVGVLAVNSPSGLIRRWARYPISVKVKNFGDAPVSFPVVAKLTAPGGALYEYTATVGDLAAGAEREVVFTTRRYNDRGEWQVYSYTDLAGDINAANDAARGAFEVRGHRGWVTAGSLPGKVAKQGGALASNGSNEYFVLLGKYTPTILRLRVDVDLPATMGTVPEPDKKVGKGTSMAYLDGRLYVLTANRSYAFQMLDVNSGNWATLANLPTGASAKPANGGAALTVVNGMIYALKGGKTSELFRYNPATNEWQALANLPDGKFAPGASLTSNGERLFALAGGNTGFWTYSIADNSWQRLAGLPVKAKVGAALGHYNGTIYATSGNGNYFYSYDLASNTWSPLENVPTDLSSKKMKIGGAIAVLDGAVLVLKGAGSTTLYAYEPEGEFYGSTPKLESNVLTGNVTPAFELKVVPNPARSFARLSVPANVPVAVNLYNANGRLVRTYNTSNCDVSNLANGVYVMKVTTDNTTTTLRLVIEH